MNALCEPRLQDERPLTASSVEVRPIHPLEDPEWDRLAASHPDASLFHGAAWARVLVRTYGHTPMHFSCAQGGRLAALVPIMEVRSPLTGRRGVSMPFADFCGPLLFSDGAPPLVLQSLANLAKERAWRHFEIRSGVKPESSAKPATSFLAHHLDLSVGTEKLLAGFDPAVRRALRKAEREGLTVRARRDRGAILDFYRLHSRTRRKHGLPPQPLAFFLNIHAEIIEAGLGSVMVAAAGEMPVAAAVFFHQGNRAIYKFGAGDERFQASRANNLVMWHGIKTLAEQGMKTLHFGRTSCGDDGLRRYKLGWGTTETSLDYFRLDVRSNSWVGGRDAAAGAHNAVFSRLPLAINRLLGRVIYPHLD